MRPSQKAGQPCSDSTLAMCGARRKNAVLLVWFLVAISCCTAAPVGKKSASEDVSPHLHTLSWETYWVDTGRAEMEQVTVPLPRDLVDQPHVFRHSVHSSRMKRMIFGEDDRTKIDPATDGKKFPYTAVMRVSTGCSGIMISEQHLLTSAHCVHDGSGYLPSALFFLRAGYVEDSGDTKWFFVKRFFVPSQWKELTEAGLHAYDDWDEYDFAVLEMKDNLKDSRDFVPPGLSGLFCDNRKVLHGADSKVEYVSFPDDKTREALWYTETTVQTESPHLLYFTGDAWHGSSGAGLYAWDYSKDSGKYERRAVGVLSGNRNTVPFASVQGNFNVAARLTAANFMMVCHWIGTEDSCRDRYREYLDEKYRDTLCRS